MNLKKRRLIIIVISAIMFSIASFSAAVYADDVSPPDVFVDPIHDPYEGFNRPMFSFNDKLDTYVLKPVATVYNAIMPRPLNQGIHNFFNNLDMLPTIANDILQLHFFQMTSDLWRLGVNTTVGVGGLFDVATRIGLKYRPNDFGLTLATWGWRNSNYLVLPFFGPYTVRDTFKIPVDYYAFSIYPYINSNTISYSLYALSIVDRRAQLLQYQPLFEVAAIDRYVFIRNAYMQSRAYQIEQHKNLGYRAQLEGNCVTNHNFAAHGCIPANDVVTAENSGPEGDPSLNATPDSTEGG